MSGNNDVMLAGALLFGAYYMSRRQGVAVQPQRPVGGNLNSLPGNIGTGLGQALGGALGGLVSSWFSGKPAADTGGNGGNYYSDNNSGSSTDWTIPIGDDLTNGNWWDTIV